MHPEKYKPQPLPEEAEVSYKYFHKPDQVMLIPVKRTVYQTDFTEGKIHNKVLIRPDLKFPLLSEKELWSRRLLC